MGYLTLDRRKILEAAVDRIFPPDDQPGGNELGAAEMIDRLLAGEVVASPLLGTWSELLTDAVAEAWQQRLVGLRSQYDQGLDDLDRRCRARSGVSFAEAFPSLQDAVLGELEEEMPAAFRRTEVLQTPATEDGLPFLRVLILHTRQGCYGDPAYGGNRDGAGWRMLGFPGPGMALPDQSD
jgi:gluconate 2-dehydrogenase gamma chain